MSAGSEAVLYDIFGDPMAVEVDTAIPTGTALLIAGGSDGTNARYIKVDSSGNQVMIGLGTAGTPAGGVISVQGVGSGTPIPVSGTVTVNAGSGNFSVVQATAALLNATVIGTVTANIGTAGGLALDATLAKLTITPGTAIGSNTLTMIGGHVTTGSPTYTNGNINQFSLTTAGALRIDGSAVTQPVSGTVTANQGGAPWSSNITQFGGVAVSTGTGASGTGIPRVTVANDSNILATQSGTWTVQQGTPPWSVVGPAADGAALSGNPIRIAGSDGTNTQNIITDTTGRLLVSGAAADSTAVTGNPVLMGGQDGTNVQSIATDGYGRPNVHIGTWFGSTAPTVGQKTMTSSIPVTMASNQDPIAVTFNTTGDTTGVSFGILKLGGSTAGILFPMRATTYTEPAAAAQRSLASSNANDTGAGTGARTVQIIYYDSIGVGPLTETVTLNGTTPVNTVASNIRFIEKMIVITAGSGGVNAGTITLYGATGGGGGTIGTIGVGNIVTGIGDNRTLWAHHYIGAGLTAKFSVLVVGVQSGGSGTSGTFFLRVQSSLIANSTEILVADAVLIIGAFERVFTFNPTVVGFSRITAYGIPGTNNCTMTCSFDWSES